MNQSIASCRIGQLTTTVPVVLNATGKWMHEWKERKIEKDFTHSGKKTIEHKHNSLFSRTVSTYSKFQVTSLHVTLFLKRLIQYKYLYSIIIITTLLQQL